jgi:hypothetical protein
MLVRSILATLVFTSAVVIAQEPSSRSAVHLAVSVVVASQNDAPVRVVAIERVENEAEPFITLENNSSLPVAAVTVAILTAAPDGCSPRPSKYASLSAVLPNPPNPQVAIPPHSRVKVSVDLYGGAFDFGRARSRYLQSQLGVQVVQFADGTSWSRTAPEKLDSEIFEPKLLRDDSPKCADWVWRNDDVPEMVTSVKFKTAAGRTTTAPSSRYTFQCVLDSGIEVCTR